jgi:hypothetical protein
MSGKYFTYSGNLVKGYIANSVPASYTACAGTTKPTSSSAAVVVSSSSKAVVSSSSKTVVASSSSKAVVSSSSKTVVASSSSKAVVSSSSKTVVASSSSKAKTASSSSKTVVAVDDEESGWWKSENTRLEENTSEKTVVTDLLVSGEKRTLTRKLKLEKGEDYTISFKAATAVDENALSIKVYDEDSKKICVDAFDIGTKSTKISCSFTATSKTATVKVVISNPLNVITIKNFSLADANTAIEPVRKGASFSIALQNKTLNISAANGERVKVQAFDMMGNSVFSEVHSINAGNASVSLDALNSGSYIIRVHGKNTTKTLKARLK